MRRFARVTTPFVVAIMLVGAGCAQPAPDEPVDSPDVEAVADDPAASRQALQFTGGTPPESRADLVAVLEQAGVAAADVGHAIQPFLTPEGRVLEFTGAPLAETFSVQSFEYESVEAAAQEATRIGPDGSPAGTHISWMAPPSYYRGGRLIVLYVGHDAEARALLSALFGEPFAGGAQDQGHAPDGGSSS